MTKQKTEDVQNEIEEQQDEFYGEGTVSGSAPDLDSGENVIDKSLEDTLGKDALEKADRHEPFSVADQVENDEEDR